MDQGRDECLSWPVSPVIGLCQPVEALAFHPGLNLGVSILCRAKEDLIPFKIQRLN